MSFRKLGQNTSREEVYALIGLSLKGVAMVLGLASMHSVGVHQYEPPLGKPASRLLGIRIRFLHGIPELLLMMGIAPVQQFVHNDVIHNPRRALIKSPVQANHAVGPTVPPSPRRVGQPHTAVGDAETPAPFLESIPKIGGRLVLIPGLHVSGQIPRGAQVRQRNRPSPGFVLNLAH